MSLCYGRHVDMWLRSSSSFSVLVLCTQARCHGSLGNLNSTELSLMLLQHLCFLTIMNQNVCCEKGPTWLIILMVLKQSHFEKKSYPGGLKHWKDQKAWPETSFSSLFWNPLILKIIILITKCVEYLFSFSQVWEKATCSSKLDETQSFEVQSHTDSICREILLHRVIDQMMLVSLAPQSLSVLFSFFFLFLRRFLSLSFSLSLFAGIRWMRSVKKWTQTETVAKTSARPSAWPGTSPFPTVTI